METKLLLKKYISILFVYAVLNQAIRPYIQVMFLNYQLEASGYSNNFNPVISYKTLTLVFVILRIIIMLIMLNDRKPKEVVEWLILGLVLVHAESAIPVFLVWNLYKHQEDKQFETK